jgi:hypothetical protein
MCTLVERLSLEDCNTEDWSSNGVEQGPGDESDASSLVRHASRFIMLARSLQLQWFRLYCG